MASTRSHDPNLQDDINEYMLRLFNAALNGEKPWNVACPNNIANDWSAPFKSDLIHAAKVLGAAWRFPGTVNVLPLNDTCLH